MLKRIDELCAERDRLVGQWRNTYRRIVQGAAVNCPYWVMLPEEKCIGQQYHALRNFCEERGLLLSRHGHTVVWEHNIYQVFMFATDEDAEVFRKQFDGERMHPSEKGTGKHWSVWRKGTYRPKRT